MKETIKMEKMLVVICIPQNAATIIMYFAAILAGRRKIIPAGIKNMPRIVSKKDNLQIFNFSTRNPAVILPKIVAIPNILSATA